MNATEQLIADSWYEVLNAEGLEVSRDELDASADYFALGGDSFQVVLVVTLLERALKTPVPVRWVFQAPSTVGALAQRLDAGDPDDDGDE